MLNVIWLAMLLLAILFGFLNHRLNEVAIAVTDSAKLAFTIGLGLAGILTFWLGLMRIAEKSGLIKLLSQMLRPLLTYLFPEVPDDHPARQAIVLNMAANILGLNNAATPFGLKAMEYLEQLNKKPGTATNAMCMLLAINTSSVQLIPTTAIAYLAAGGSHEPTAIIVSALLATSCSTLVAIVAAKCFESIKRFH